MGRSAKLHKRRKKTASTSQLPVTPPAPSVQSAKKRAGLKSKAKARSGAQATQGDRVLGGADYVTLMLGGRRKAAEEALKLPTDPDE